MNDPKRLIVSEDNELGVALAVARRQLPDVDRLALLAQRLAENGVNAPLDMPVHTEPMRSPRGLGFKVKIGVGMAALAGLGLFGVASRSHSTATNVAQLAHVSESVPALVSSGESSVSTAASAALRAPLARVVSQPEAREAPVAEIEAAAAPTVPSSAPLAVVSHAAPPAPSHARTSTPTQAESQSSNSVYVPPSGAELPMSELELVKQARNAVAADPARAYALTERSRAQFPNGAFGQERDFIALTALFRLGREQQARSQASTFRSRYPRSAYLPQIQRMLGEP